jgi:hypothetical protein
VPFIPQYENERPTLGWLAIQWMHAYLARPDTPEYAPLVLTREQAEFFLRFYELDPVTGRRKQQRGVISRGRGWGKSPIGGGAAAFEALGPAHPDGWDANGRPVGKPWSDFRKPLVEIAAVSEDQVNTNTWSPLMDMLGNDKAYDEYPGLEVMQGFINLPYGKIQKRTAEATSAKGAPAHFVVCDQTESWVVTNLGQKLYKTLKNNVIKRGGTMLELPNAFTPGDGSVAETTMAAYRAILAGQTRLGSGVYFDHREAPPETDLTDRESLVAGLAYAYGDSADVPFCSIHNPPCPNPGWVDLQHIADSIWDPDTDVQLAKSDWLNQITHASDSFLSQPVWKGALADPMRILGDRDMIVLGFDGSRGKAKGKPDATALVGCRVSDGHLFEIGVWEAGDIPSHGAGPALDGCDCWKCWEPPIVEIEAAIDQYFRDYVVAAFYADPGKDWRSHVNAWEAKYGQRVQFSASPNHPFEWWMTGGRAGLVERAIEQFESAVKNHDLTHDGSYGLTRHVLNARRRFSHGKLALAKENDYSPKKIDAAVAAVLAYQARLDALVRAVKPVSDFYVPQRLY